MSQSTEAPASTGQMLDDGATQRTPSAILFTELVLAHFRWFTLCARYGEFGGLPVELAPAGWPPKTEHSDHDADRRDAEARYRQKLREFTEAEGEIVAAYWSVKVPSGIVMTMETRGPLLNRLRGPRISLHRATTWLTGSDSPVAELLHHCDTLGNKVAHILTRTPKEVAMTWIFSTESYLLGVVEGRRCEPIPPRSETNGRRPPEERSLSTATSDATEAAADEPMNSQGDRSTKSDVDEPTHAELIARGRSEIVEIEKYYARAAANAARFLYFWGMLVGAVIAGAAAVVIAVIAAAAFDVIRLDSTSTRFFFACYAAGALGAIVSVLTRMRTDRFALDYEVGRMPAFWLGAFRPFIGAVFGLVVYFALQSELLQVQRPDESKAFFFFTLFAFAAGFSERLTHVILGGAQRTVERTLEQADRALGEKVTTTEERRDGTVVTRTTKKARATL